MTHVNDEDKIAGARLIEPILSANSEPWPLPATVDAGHAYGWRREAGDDHQRALDGARMFVESWYSGLGPVVDHRQRTHVGDAEKIALANAVTEIVGQHERVDLMATLFDCGCRFGQVVQETGSISRAFHYVGSKLAEWYGVDHPWRPKPGTHPDPIVGQLRYGDRCFADDHGPRNLCGIHLGDLIGQGLRFGLQHLEPTFDAVQRAGYHWIRSWTNVKSGGRGWWADKPVPEWDIRDDRQRTHEILSAAAARGIRWHLAPGGLADMSNSDEDALFDAIRDAIDAVGPEHVALMEGCNEVGGTGDRDDKEPGELARLIERVRSRHPQLLYSLTAAAGADESREVIARFTLPWMQHYYLHGLRSGRLHDKLRHIFSMGYDGEHPTVRRLGWQGEPWGNGRLVSVTHNKHELDASGMVLGAAMSAVARQAWTVMGGSSVVLYDDPLESPGFHEVPALVRELPRDLAQFDILSHSGPTRRGQRIWAARGDVRSDYAIHADGRFVAINYGPPEQNPHALEQERGTRDERVLHQGAFGRVVIGRLR